MTIQKSADRGAEDFTSEERYDRTLKQRAAVGIAVIAAVVVLGLIFVR